jgi:threonylcarbamoyladenosine tRNA methylthiotransferase MtaB
MPRNFAATLKIVLTGVNIGDYGKGIWKQKHEHTFLELVQELDKVEGIERLQNFVH